MFRNIAVSIYTARFYSCKVYELIVRFLPPVTTSIIHLYKIKKFVQMREGLAVNHMYRA
jgi:hypothetical protein